MRAAALVRVVRAVLTGGRLSLTHLGRHLSGTARVKHQIEAVDRLLGNQHLQRERGGVYRAIAQTLLHGNRRPVIVVDWSDFQHGRECVMLKAALPIGGRAISLYERAFPFKRYNSPGAHCEFQRELHALLPQNCSPIIITDAGFRGPWFRQVESYGWARRLSAAGPPRRVYRFSGVGPIALDRRVSLRSTRHPPLGTNRAQHGHRRPALFPYVSVRRILRAIARDGVWLPRAVRSRSGRRVSARRDPPGMGYCVDGSGCCALGALFV